ncbi:hypothetical protein YC2023_031762 [Brassica napus]
MPGKDIESRSDLAVSISGCRSVAIAVLFLAVMSAPQWTEAKKQQKNDRKGGSSERFLKSSNIAMHGSV